MHIARLELRDFRSYGALVVDFKPGLNLVVGENNIGKSHIMDALRMILSLGSGRRDVYARPQDIRHDASGDPMSDRFEISVTLDDLSEEQMAWFLPMLIAGESVARLNLRYRRMPSSGGRERHSLQTWGGDLEGPSIETEILDTLQCVFLQPLRDAEADLRPGRGSRTASLLERLADDKSKVELERAIETANSTIESTALVRDAAKCISGNLVDICGTALAQKSELALAEPSFRRIAQSIRTLVGDDVPLDVSENGLGYNNILYAATVLAELKDTTQEDKELGVLLIEEPEAHLHPQLQAPFIRYLEQQAQNGIQVFATTHSTTVASSVGVERSIVVHADRTTGVPGAVTAKHLAECGLDEHERRLLTRYLDMTRSSLLFARGVILVEGISELLLMPTFARKIGLDLKDCAVSVICVNGLSFRPFYKLFMDGNIRIPCAIVTDADPPVSQESSEEQAEVGSRVAGMQEEVDGCCQVFAAAKTFEYALAAVGNAEAMVEVFTRRHPVAGKRLKNALKSFDDRSEIARAVHAAIDKGYKAEVAHDLLMRWEDRSEGLHVPKYIGNAIRFACGVQR